MHVSCSVALSPDAASLSDSPRSTLHHHSGKNDFAHAAPHPPLALGVPLQAEDLPYPPCVYFLFVQTSEFLFFPNGLLSSQHLITLMLMSSQHWSARTLPKQASYPPDVSLLFFKHFLADGSPGSLHAYPAWPFVSPRALAPLSGTVLGSVVQHCGCPQPLKCLCYLTLSVDRAGKYMYACTRVHTHHTHTQTHVFLSQFLIFFSFLFWWC